MIRKTIIEKSKTKGVEGKQSRYKLQVIRMLSKNKLMSIAEICSEIKLTIPTGTKILTLLQADGLVQAVQKFKTGEVGRAPSMYRLVANTILVAGLEITLRHLRLCITNIEGKVIFKNEDTDFRLQDSMFSLQKTIDFINASFKKSKVSKQDILGLGVALTGRVNAKEGISYSYFNRLEKPLAECISQEIKLPVYIDNDSRSIGVAEYLYSKSNKQEDTLVINLSRGLGMALFSQGNILTGSNGFFGEVGHMKMGVKDRLCICGSRGCLGTEVSGSGLEQDIFELAHQGTKFSFEVNEQTTRYNMILKAAIQGDGQAREAVEKIILQLGVALGNVLNLMNPQRLILAGSFSIMGESILNMLKSGIRQTALPLPYETCNVEISQIGGEAGMVGASSLVLYRMELT